MRFTTPTILATFAATSNAYSATQRTFAVNHFYGKGPLVEGRLDPIINPGVASGHVHTVQGGNAFALSMTDTQALDQSTCTSSLVKNDKSNYWAPKLYFQAKNGTIHDVDLFYMNVYYFFEPTTDKIEAFQPGHRMVIGNPTLRTPPATGGKSILDLADGTPQPVQWTCPRSNTAAPLYPTNSNGLHGAGIQDPNNAGAGVGFPDQNCDGYASPLRADIHFPSCYNPAEGLDAYKTNMQFPTNGNCPKGWIHTPHLFYELYWNTPVFASEWEQGQGTQPFVLAQGDPTGYGLHADFISGWDVNTLQQIIDNCDAGDSGMDKCPGLIGGLNDPSTSCNIVSPIKEFIVGSLDALPGNNPITPWGSSGAGPAPASSASPIASTPASSLLKPISAAGGETKAAGGTEATSTPVEIISTTALQAPSSPVVQSVSSPSIAPTVTSAPVSSPQTLVTSYKSETTIIETTVTEPTPTATGSSTVAAGWSYHGCYSDSLSGNRALDGITFANVGQHSVTNTKCVAYCNSKGYTLAGTEYGGQCFCGNSLNDSSALAASSCDMPCEGDATQTCGGSLALSVYSSSSQSKRRSRHLHQHMRSHQE